MRLRNLIHICAGTLALLCVFSFWTSTVIAEVFLSGAAVSAVKGFILKAMWLMVPAIMLTGISGFRLALHRGGRMVEAKKKRMQLIAVNGLAILLPSAIFLYSKAVDGDFDRMFYVVQALELMAGAVNFALLGANFRNGLKLSRGGRLDDCID